jgi:wobble nucleotide-excising tRNase
MLRAHESVDKKKKTKKDTKKDAKKDAKKDIKNKAATLIQAVYRSYIVRKTFKKLLEKGKKRRYTIAEILSTEKVYLESLKTTVEVVTCYLFEVSN